MRVTRQERGNRSLYTEGTAELGLGDLGVWPAVWTGMTAAVLYPLPLRTTLEALKTPGSPYHPSRTPRSRVGHKYQYFMKPPRDSHVQQMLRKAAFKNVRDAK